MAKKKAAFKKGCNCIKSVQEQLAQKNIYVVQHLQMDFETGEGRMSPPSLVVDRLVGTKGKIPTVFCTYCPFCGTKY